MGFDISWHGVRLMAHGFASWAGPGCRGPSGPGGSKACPAELRRWVCGAFERRFEPVVRPAGGYVYVSTDDPDIVPRAPAAGPVIAARRSGRRHGHLGIGAAALLSPRNTAARPGAGLRAVHQPVHRCGCLDRGSAWSRGAGRLGVLRGGTYVLWRRVTSPRRRANTTGASARGAGPRPRLPRDRPSTYGRRRIPTARHRFFGRTESSMFPAHGLHHHEHDVMLAARSPRCCIRFVRSQVDVVHHRLRRRQPTLGAGRPGRAQSVRSPSDGLGVESAPGRRAGPDRSKENNVGPRPARSWGRVLHSVDARPGLADWLAANGIPPTGPPISATTSTISSDGVVGWRWRCRRAHPPCFGRPTGAHLRRRRRPVRNLSIRTFGRTPARRRWPPQPRRLSRPGSARTGRRGSGPRPGRHRP